MPLRQSYRNSSLRSVVKPTNFEIGIVVSDILEMSLR